MLKRTGTAGLFARPLSSKSSPNGLSSLRLFRTNSRPYSFSSIFEQEQGCQTHLSSIIVSRRHCATTSNEQRETRAEEGANSQNEGSTFNAFQDQSQPPPPPSVFVKTAAAVRPPPPLPNFDTDFEAGTGRFTLIGKGPCEGVFISCVVPANHKPRVLQLHDSGDRSAGGVMSEDGTEFPNRSRADDNDAWTDSNSRFLREAARDQTLYHKHLWTSAKQRLGVNRRKLQRRRDAAKAAGLLANRAATLEAYLQQQHNQSYSTSTAGGSEASSSSAFSSLMKRNKALNGCRIGKMTLLCPPRPFDPTPPAPENASPPPPLSKHQMHRSRLLEDAAIADNNPHRAIVGDPFENERELHRKQYLALDTIVAEDNAEQVPLRFRVGLLARKKKVQEGKRDYSSVGGNLTSEEAGSADASDVLADFLDAPNPKPSSQERPDGEENLANRSDVSKFTNLMLHLSCSTIAPAAALSVDAVNFFKDPTAFLETSVETTDETMKSYLGPQIHQRHLALYACNREGQLNKYVFPSASGHLESVSIKNFFRSDVFPEMSVADRGAHLPVHTVPPELHDALRLAVAERGVDDELALYVHRYAQYVFAQERLLWRQRLVSFLKRGSLVPPSSPSASSE